MQGNLETRMNEPAKLCMVEWAPSAHMWAAGFPQPMCWAACWNDPFFDYCDLERLWCGCQVVFRVTFPGGSGGWQHVLRLGCGRCEGEWLGAHS